MSLACWVIPNAKVLVNMFKEIERNAFSSIANYINLIGVGPILQSFSIDNAKAASNFHLFKLNEKGYMEWVNSSKTIVCI